MPRVEVDPQSYFDASGLFYTANRGCVDAMSALVSGLADGAQMAGSDSGGMSWASAYDPAAATAVSVGCDLANALGLAGDLLGQTGDNHANADASSTLGGPPTYPGRDSAGGSSAESITAPAPPSASGGSGGEPHGWFLIAHLLAYTWPNGQQDKLRAVGAAWTSAADAVRAYRPEVSQAAGLVGGQRSPEAPAAETACNQLGTQLDDLAAQFAALGAACNTYASEIDQAHHDIIGELESLLEWTVAIESVGLVAGIFTAGIAEGGAQAAEAGRIAATAARVTGIIERLVEAAGSAARTVGDAGRFLAENASKLKTFLSGEKNVAGMQAVRDAGAEGERLAGIDPKVAKVRIPSDTNSAAYRIPDKLDAKNLTEVKNVKSLSNTKQLQDFLAYAQQTKRTFTLVVRSNTVLTKELDGLVKAGKIVLKRQLPG
jgi:hypothetical protein